MRRLRRSRNFIEWGKIKKENDISSSSFLLGLLYFFCYSFTLVLFTRPRCNIPIQQMCWHQNRILQYHFPPGTTEMSFLLFLRSHFQGRHRLQDDHARRSCILFSWTVLKRCHIHLGQFWSQWHVAVCTCLVKLNSVSDILLFGMLLIEASILSRASFFSSKFSILYDLIVNNLS